MKNQKLIIGAFITLVILNLVLIGILLLGKTCHGNFPGGHGRHHMKSHFRGPKPNNQLAIFANKLDLSKEQKEKFSIELDSFHSEMEQLMDEKITLKKQLLQPTAEKETDLLLDKIAAAERALAALEYKHFNSLKAVLTEEQKTKFDTIVSRMNSFRGPRGPHFRKHLRQ